MSTVDKPELDPLDDVPELNGLEAEPRFLLVPAEGDIDEDEGLTRREMVEMLAAELGLKVVENE